MVTLIDTCSMVYEVEDGKLLGVKGNKDHLNNTWWTRLFYYVAQTSIYSNHWKALFIHINAFHKIYAAFLGNAGPMMK